MNAPACTQRLLLRVSVWIALAGLSCLAFFLWRRLSIVSLGIGVVLGVPLILLAVVLYLIAVVRDLRCRRVL